MEGFLARLAASKDSDDFVPKGGVLMAAFAARRPTRDIDLAATVGFSNDIRDVEQQVRAIIAHPLDDGLAFEPDSVSGDEIREDADYTGVRVRIVARLATARIALHVDVNFGDPIWPAPIEAELPLLLGGSLRLRGYPDHMVLAEKIVTAIDRGDQNTRWRDFVDIAAIIGTRRIRYHDVHEALTTVAAYRAIALEPMTTLLEQMPGLAQSKRTVWRSKQRLFRIDARAIRRSARDVHRLRRPRARRERGGLSVEPRRLFMGSGMNGAFVLKTRQGDQIGDQKPPASRGEFAT